MYNVNQTKIDEALRYMEQKLITIAPILNSSIEQFRADELQVLAAERVLHIAIESIVDVGNHIIDGFIMRDPGSYLDIIEILEDEQVVSKELAQSLKNIVAYRKVLVHDYTAINSDEIYQLLKTEHQAIMSFGDAIRTYLAKELI